jgi:acyl-CoA reductase-like NAD-dependent aldehyde dehydrogenase
VQEWRPTLSDVHTTPLKTLKFYVAGSFLRSESGATFPVAGYEIPNCSRKDARDAIRAGAAAAQGWASRDPYNRGQILYRVAEMLTDRREEFVALLTDLGVDHDAADQDVSDAIAAWVHYAGWTDKLGQVLGCTNDVPSVMVSYTAPTPLGLVVAVCGNAPGLAGLSVTAASALAAGNAVTVTGSSAWSVPALVFAEVAAVSDLPSGVFQVMTSTRPELALTLASASQVQGLDLSLVNDSSALAAASVETFTRVLRRVPGDPLGRLRWQVERRTFWHPQSR